jgi:hypothetical protein
MPDPANTIAVGQGADWKPVPGHGWDDVPFPPQGNIRMRYLYAVTGSTPQSATVQVMACGNFPGLGPAIFTFGTSGAKCNYTVTDTIVANATPIRTEAPAMSFEGL